MSCCYHNSSHDSIRDAGLKIMLQLLDMMASHLQYLALPVAMVAFARLVI